MEIGGVLHVAGFLFLLIVFIFFGEKPKEITLLSVIGLAIAILFLGAGYNLVFSDFTIMESIIFRRVSYGSFFISVGYALLLYVPYLAIVRSVGKTPE